MARSDFLTLVFWLALLIGVGETLAIIRSTPEFSVKLLNSGSNEHVTAEGIELAASRRALLTLKDELGPEGILRALEPEIERANTAWHAILASASGGDSGHVASEARLQATGLHAEDFLAWFAADTGDPHKMTGAHPEHFVEEMTVAEDGTTSVHILEGWGPLVVHYNIPSYGPNPKKPWMKALPDFPFQAVGDAVLVDGTVIGNIHNSFKETADGGGMEAVLCVWLPDSTPGDVVEGLRKHQEVEFFNWMTAAYRDISSGNFKPPS